MIILYKSMWEYLLEYKMTNILLTVCSKGKSIFSGLLRLVPKIIKPESIPAEWRALSKLKQKRIIKNEFMLYFHIFSKFKKNIIIS